MEDRFSMRESKCKQTERTAEKSRNPNNREGEQYKSSSSHTFPKFFA